MILVAMLLLPWQGFFDLLQDSAELRFITCPPWFRNTMMGCVEIFGIHFACVQ